MARVRGGEPCADVDERQSCEGTKKGLPAFRKGSSDEIDGLGTSAISRDKPIIHSQGRDEGGPPLATRGRIARASPNAA